MNNWLKNDGGHGKIRYWLKEWLLASGGPVSPGAEAPNSSLKIQMSYENSSGGQQYIHNLLLKIRDEVEGDILILDTDLVSALKDDHYRGHPPLDRLEKPMTVRKIARGQGWFEVDRQIKFKPWGIKMAAPRMLVTNEQHLSLSPAELHEIGVKPLDLKPFMTI